MKKMILPLLLLVLFCLTISRDFNVEGDFPVIYPSRLLVPTNTTCLEDAVAIILEGGTIEVEYGTYYEFLTIQKSLSFVGRRNATLDGRYKNYRTNPYQISIKDASNISISGLTFQCANTLPYACGIYVENSWNVTVVNCIFADTTSFGITLKNVTNARILNNIIDSAYEPLTVIRSSNIVFAYNTLRDASEQFQFYDSRDITFHHNNVFNDEWSSHPSNDYPRVSNTTCTWDDGAQGNYWSDYLTRYPNASKQGEVWDAPYQIDPDDLDGMEHFDSYPLTEDPQLPKLKPEQRGGVGGGTGKGAGATMD